MKTTYRKKMKLSASKYACNYKKNAYICIGDINLIVTPLIQYTSAPEFYNSKHGTPRITHYSSYSSIFLFIYFQLGYNI